MINIGDRVVVWPDDDADAFYWRSDAKECIGKSFIVKEKIGDIACQLEGVRKFRFQYKNLILINDSCIFANN